MHLARLHALAFAILCCLAWLSVPTAEAGSADKHRMVKRSKCARKQWVQKVADLETSTTHPSPFLTQAVEAPGVTRASSSSEGPSVPTDTPPSPPPAESAQPSNLGGQQESKVKPHTVDNTALPPQTSGGTRQSKAVPSPSKAAKADPSPSKAAPAVPSASQSADKGNKASPKVGKAGLGWNAESGTEWKQFLDIPGNQIGWTYNWDSKRLSDGLYPAGLNFVPMLHGDKANHPADFEVNKKNFKDWGVTHVMSFNEPDIPTGGAGGSGMSTPDAVKMHQKYFTSELNKDFKIVAPAYSGLAGFVEWEKACNKQCLYDVIPLHYYGKTLDGLTKLLDEAEKKFPGKPIWVTEIGCIQYGESTYYCTEDEVKDFMKHALPVLHKRTERYAWQGSFTKFNGAPANKNNMMDDKKGNPINEKGRIYVTTT